MLLRWSSPPKKDKMLSTNRLVDLFLRSVILRIMQLYNFISRLTRDVLVSFSEISHLANEKTLKNDKLTETTD